MSYCLNPQCQNPQNPEGTLYCIACGSKLLLRERYRPIKPIGRGGFGRTFFAVDEDKPSHPPCVIKQFLPQNTGDPKKAAELFQQEAVRLDELGKHPQIPELLAHFEQDNYQYLVQEFIDGSNLAQESIKNGPFDSNQIQQMLNELLPVLKFIHEQKVIHRDLKPENIICRSSTPETIGWMTNTNKLVLVDFGAAKVITGTSLMQPGTIIGSPEYVAPEQLRGHAIFASDIYSLGVTCIYLLTQISPFDLFDVMADKWVWRDYLNQPFNSKLGKVIDKMLMTNPQIRYQSALEVMKELNPTQAFPTAPNTFPPTASTTKRSTSSPIPNRPTMATYTSPKQPTKQSTNSITAPPYVIQPTVLPQPQQSTWKCVLTLTGHFDSVNSVAFSPDNQILASGSRDKTIEIWDMTKGKRWFTLTGHGNSVSSVAFSPDNQMLASGSRDKTIEIWDMKKGKRWFTLLGHSDWVDTVAFSPDNQMLASGGRDRAIEIWNLQKARRWFTLAGHQDRVYTVAFNKDGGILASGGRDQTIKIWDLQKAKELFSIQGHSDWVRSLSFSPDGGVLGSGSRDGTVKLWQVYGGELISTPIQHLKYGVSDVLSVGFSPNGKIVAAGYRNGVINLWDAVTGELLETLNGHSSDVFSVVFSQDGRSLASGSNDKTIKIWQVP
ncbi:serine/threonine protein kinase with WD40 repeats [Trichodesmium erythraeum IMS101]|uniref:Serine/threonine protein kinase with WD40 repeats n=1 Tax=Trichodesmium erythraeum (strain IMS101) TaxID=203124 RepID=Q10YD2_TRIEI|nr:protein kinase [Trichodesmium erythraeum GBRTRLIN201]MCH2049764.1 protein kinase [Trichodesmium sp. ALOHA_ZT_67]MDT9338994.1 protein kinase [Trichodesmium erythraeum 21-75]